MFNHALSSYLQRVSNQKFYIFILGFGLLFVLSGCERKSAELKAVEEAASIIQPTTGRQVYQYTEDKDWTFVRTINANLRLHYEPIDGYTKEDVHEEIVTILKENNWERDEWRIEFSDYFPASLHEGRYPLSVIVSIDSDEDFVYVSIENR